MRFAMNNQRRKPIKYLTERITIDKLVPGGQGLATFSDGKKIFLWNALPGEVAHGCINLPPQKAAVLFDHVYKNMPIICHN